MAILSNTQGLSEQLHDTSRNESSPYQLTKEPSNRRQKAEQEKRIVSERKIRKLKEALNELANKSNYQN